jgi:hypothetical protein
VNRNAMSDCHLSSRVVRQRNERRLLRRPTHERGQSCRALASALALPWTRHWFAASHPLSYNTAPHGHVLGQDCHGDHLQRARKVVAMVSSPRVRRALCPLIELLLCSVSYK